MLRGGVRVVGPMRVAAYVPQYVHAVHTRQRVRVLA